MLIVFLLSCLSPFSESLPRGVATWSAVCYCGISWSYSTYFLVSNYFSLQTLFRLNVTTRPADKRHFFKTIFVSYFSTKTYVLSTLTKGFNEKVLLSTHKVC